MNKRKNCNPQRKNKKQSVVYKDTPARNKNTKCKPEKLTSAEFADMNQIEWVPFDPYGD